MNLWQASAAELTAGYARGDFSPREALDAVLARIEAVNPKLNAIVTFDIEGARRAADASTARWRSGTTLGDSRWRSTHREGQHPGARYARHLGHARLRRLRA